MFCVRCGEEPPESERGNENVLVGGLCHACYLEERTFTNLGPHVDLEVCVHCGSRRRGEIWVGPNLPLEAAVQDAVAEAAEFERGIKDVRVRVELTREDERNLRAEVRITGTSEGIAFEESHTTRARVKGATCLRCSRLVGNYFEAIVQVRARRRELFKDEMRNVRQLASRIIDRVVGEGDPNAFVLKDEDVHGGLDIYFGTTNSARMVSKAIVNELGGVVTEHPKVAGKRDGNDIWRITFAIRLPEYRAGDLVVLKNSDVPQVVRSISPKSVTLRDPLTGRLHSAERASLDDRPVLFQEDAREAVIVSREAGELQVLDPWTYSTVTMLRPEGLPDEATTVPVVKHEGQLIPSSVRPESLRE